MNRFKQIDSDFAAFPKKATIKVEHNFARLEPAVDAVERLLTLSTRDFTNEGPLGYGELNHRVVHADRVDDSLEFSAGFASRVMEFLERNGVRVEFTEPLRRLAPHRNLVDATALERTRLQTIVDRNRTRIEVVDENDARELCRFVAKSFSKAKVMIVVPNAAIARTTMKSLSGRIGRPVRLHLTGARARKARVHIGIARSFPIDSYDLLILPFLDRCLGKASLERIGQCIYRAKRVVGCCIAGKRLDRERGFWCEKITGQIISSVSSPHVPLLFAMLPLPDCRTNPATTQYGRVRTLFDDNAARNQFVARVAKGFSEAPREAFASLLGKAAQLSKESQKKTRIVVLVESARQGRELARYLPKWNLQVGHPRGLHGLERNSESPHSIVTSYFAAVSGVAADVLIRATGRREALRVRRFPAKATNSRSGQCALIIDFDDRFNVYAAMQARTRRREYLISGAKELNVRDSRKFKWILPEANGAPATHRRGS